MSQRDRDRVEFYVSQLRGRGFGYPVAQELAILKLHYQRNRKAYD